MSPDTPCPSNHRSSRGPTGHGRRHRRRHRARRSSPNRRHRRPCRCGTGESGGSDAAKCRRHRHRSCGPSLCETGNGVWKWQWKAVKHTYRERRDFGEDEVGVSPSSARMSWAISSSWNDAMMLNLLISQSALGTRTLSACDDVFFHGQFF
ncbi:hypothetical protein BCR44DRAFT_316147 [Catenaria anguillulae PL171]|uniref:Uncharacterized protein n=1 Tax=Catenaria anguillulae PL171 TaxID=765915 RepID=A0A1Y2I037_9FUNG|nr:hypothetical protein BCR44DRAFT_316147 [Catenaria anguillulae PL171]